METEVRTSRDGLGQAEFSCCGRYRYRLSRTRLTTEHAGGGRVVWIMLNPSIATEEVLDPTLRRCWAYTLAWGHRVMDVLNLFALRSTNPKNLLQVDDPVGPHNDLRIEEAVRGASMIIAGWGAHPLIRKLHRDRQVLALFPNPVYALRVTKSGAPGHPLYLPKGLVPQAYPPKFPITPS